VARCDVYFGKSPRPFSGFKAAFLLLFTGLFYHWIFSSYLISMTRIALLGLASSLVLTQVSAYVIYITVGLGQGSGCHTEWLYPYRSLSNISSDGTVLSPGQYQTSISADGDRIGELMWLLYWVAHACRQLTVLFQKRLLMLTLPHLSILLMKVSTLAQSCFFSTGKI
jgi:hypothetical protein